MLNNVLRREEYREKVLRQAGEWYFEGKGGVFARPSGRNKIDKLIDVKELLDQPPNVSGEQYPNEREVKDYWDMVVAAKQAITPARDRGEEGREEVRELKEVVEGRTWAEEGMKRGVDVLKGVLGLGEVVGWEAAVG